MKQLFIVKSNKALNATGATPKDLSGLEKGAITFFYPGEASPLSTKPTKNYCIALGRGTNAAAMVIPEVDVNTLSVQMALPSAGAAFSAAVTIPETLTSGKNYTLVLVKKGTVFNERNTWTATEFIPVGETVTGAQMATKLYNYFKAVADSGSLPISVSLSTRTITITGLNKGEDFELKPGDGLLGESVTTTNAEKVIGDKAFVQDLASRCAGGKGFYDTYADGDSVYPGYPEEVEDLVPNTSGDAGASTAGYAIFTLRFAVKRASAKTRDEVVNQEVHLAVPITNASFATIKTILGVS